MTADMNPFSEWMAQVDACVGCIPYICPGCGGEFHDFATHCEICPDGPDAQEVPA